MAGVGQVEAVAAVLGVAVAAGVAAGTWWRGRQNNQRSEWRKQDRAEGWRDDGGQWHVGAIDQVLGYTDAEGRYHDGLNKRVTVLEGVSHAHPRPAPRSSRKSVGREVPDGTL